MNEKFLDYFMSKFGIKVATMTKFLDCSSKTVYNYRQMHYSKLPEKVWHKIFNFFFAYNMKQIQTFTELYDLIESMDEEDIIEGRVRFIRNAEVRFNMRETGYIDSFTRDDGGIKITTNEDLKRANDFEERMRKFEEGQKNFKAIESKRSNQLNPNYKKKTSSNNKTISINSSGVSELYVKVLEKELNDVVINDDYDFISYLKKYKHEK